MAVTRKKLEVKTAFKVITGKMSVTEGMERNQDITVALRIVWIRKKFLTQNKKCQELLYI